MGISAATHPDIAFERAGTRQYHAGLSVSPGAHRMFTTTRLLAALVLSGAIHHDAGRPLANIVRNVGTATKDGIACILPFTGNSYTRCTILIAFGVFAAADLGGAFVGSAAAFFDALAGSIANKMLGSTASQEWIAFIGSLSCDNNTGIVLAFRMLTASDGSGTRVASGPRKNHALGSLTNSMCL